MADQLGERWIAEFADDHFRDMMRAYNSCTQRGGADAGCLSPPPGARRSASRVQMLPMRKSETLLVLEHQTSLRGVAMTLAYLVFRRLKIAEFELERCHNPDCKNLFIVKPPKVLFCSKSCGSHVSANVAKKRNTRSLNLDRVITACAVLSELGGESSSACQRKVLSAWVPLHLIHAKPKHSTFLRKLIKTFRDPDNAKRHNNAKKLTLVGLCARSPEMWDEAEHWLNLCKDLIIEKLGVSPKRSKRRSGSTRKSDHCPAQTKRGLSPIGTGIDSQLTRQAARQDL